MNLFTKQKQNYRYRKQTYAYQKGTVGRRDMSLELTYIYYYIEDR